MQTITSKHFTWIGLKCLHVEDVFYYHSVCCDYNCLHQRITLNIAPPPYHCQPQFVAVNCSAYYQCYFLVHEIFL